MQASLEPKNPTVFQTNLDLSYITMWLRNQLFLTLKKKKVQKNLQNFSYNQWSRSSVYLHSNIGRNSKVSIQHQKSQCAKGYQILN